MAGKFKKGDRVVVVDDGSSAGSRKPKLKNGDEHVVWEVRDSDGMLELEGLAGWYLPFRFELAHAYDIAIDMTVSGAGVSMTADPGKPFPDPEAEARKSAEEKLREYRRSLRDMIGL